MGKYWTVTLCNYGEEDLEMWRKVVGTTKATYLCYQQEKCPSTGTPHLQAFIAFSSNHRLTGVKKVLGGRIHAVLSNGTPSANRAYCSKPDSAIEGTFEEYGKLPKDPARGKRNDFEEFRNAVAGGLRDKKKARELFPALTAKYPRWCYDVIDDYKVIDVEDHEMYEWQKDLLSTLSEPADDRKVIFVVDPRGNNGKTWFAKYYCKTHDDAQYLEPGKKADMAYALQDNLRVLFLNVTRTSESKNHEYLYSFVEALKDGMVFSPKYESRVKYFSKVHVVVLMNSPPDKTLLSEDRYDEIYLK